MVRWAVALALVVAVGGCARPDASLDVTAADSTYSKIGRGEWGRAVLPTSAVVPDTPIISFKRN